MDLFHNNKRKNANSVVEYEHKIFTIVYRNATIVYMLNLKFQ